MSGAPWGGQVARRKVRRLSYGMRAQLSLALALAPDPDLLILDDPTTGLDSVARREFLVSLMQFIRREGRTIFFSSHIMSDVQRVADRIGILLDGVLRVDCPTSQFMECVCKVVLHFTGQPPQFPGCEGLVSAHVDECRLELVIVNFDDSQREVVESLSPADWEVVEMNLEDACIEYTRGPKKRFHVGADEGAAS
ncbi:MAG TPA: ATP-binding cassette domain-containing protein [Pirellulales bacterium]|nr:ATP-binding cassette domain-containing protein [Pirellulales bacterium]